MKCNYTNKLEDILTPETLLQKLQSLTSAKHFWVGYSGGLDSRVLLELMARAFQTHASADFQVGAIHIHHGLSPNADAWLEHCKSVCSELKIPFQVFWVNAKVTDGESQEEVAREARFKAFRDFIKKDECLLLAHHEEDQTETILMRLFRGAGPTGLSGMAEKMQMGHCEILRPLLSISKTQLEQYAKGQNLQWIHDDSNHNMRFDRNFLRHEILPRLKTRWPQVVRSVNRSGSLCLETAMASQQVAAYDYQTVLGKAYTVLDKTYYALSVKALLTLEPIRRRGVIRYWLQMQKFTLPSQDHMARIDREVLQAKPGAKPKLKISKYVIKRLKDELLVERYIPAIDVLQK